jgi:hypothetical protein
MKKISILFLTIVVFACQTIKVSYDYDRQADLTKYRTYKLSDETLNLQIQQLNRDRIINAVENGMAAKGFSKSENPDIIVDINLASEEKQTATATTTGSYYGSRYRGWNYGSGFSTTQINYDKYVEGTLVITFVDAKKEQIVWQGSGTKTLIENASAEKRDENINKAVQQILNNYPPAKK